MMPRNIRPNRRAESRGRLQREEGSALIIALMATALLTALGLALVLTTSTETLISSNYRSSQEAFYGADAALERGMQDLLTVEDWNMLLAADNEKSSFVDTSADQIAPDGSKVNLVALTAAAQSETDAVYGADPNRPVWHLYAHSSLEKLLLGSVTTRGYGVVWVSDDPAETDGNPATDTNGILLVRAEAQTEFGSRKAVEASVRRNGDPPDPERGYRGQRGLGERNDRYRDQGISNLTQMQMDTEAGTMVEQ